MMTRRELIAGIDAGGTSFKLGIAERAEPRLLTKTRVPTTSPDETIERSAAALLAMAEEAGGFVGKLGIASFGPVDVDPSSPGYGTILATPKPGWANTALLARLGGRLGAAGMLDTDVNAALEAEMRFGGARGATRAAYVTIGTGIGVGVRTEGGFAGRPSHPELGHIRVERHPRDRSYAGRCAFHQDCLEGLASAPALTDRFGPLEDLPPRHEAWEVAGFYLGQLALTLRLGFRLQRIVFGGGVMLAPRLLGRVRHHAERLNAGYLPEALGGGELIRPAALGQDAGLIGALLLTQRPA
jgi:fructokinase